MVDLGGGAARISEDALVYIRENCSLTCGQLRDHIHEKFGVDVSEQAVWAHMREARLKAEEATRNVDAHINKQIADRVDNKVLDLMDMLEGEILKLYNTLQGQETNIGIKPDLDKNGDPTGKLNGRDYASFEKLFQDSVKNYVQLRPTIQTVKVEGLGDRFAEDEFMKSLTDDEVSVLEGIAKKREKFEESE